MTKQRNDEHSTEFGLWLREQDQIGSDIGYVATNLDFIWSNYKTGQWMLLEEKRKKCRCSWSQNRQFETLHKSIVDKKYCGFHSIQFENLSPDDGKVFINGKELINNDMFIWFLQFDPSLISYFTNEQEYKFLP